VVRDKFGFTADGLEIVRSLRRLLLRHQLVRNATHPWQRGPLEGTLGRDYLIWSGLRQEFAGDAHTVTGARGLGNNWTYRDAEAPVVRDFVADEPMAQAWEALLAELCSWPFMAAEDPAESLQLYVVLGEEAKNLAAAILAAQALVRSANVPGWRVKAHDKLAALAGAGDDVLRRGWKPTPGFVALFPKLKRLELAQPHVEPEAFRTWHKRDDKTITGAVAGRARAGSPGLGAPAAVVQRQRPGGRRDVP
jgi:ParB family chromosome partitioning protein